jgi:hypothetical protein
MRWRTASMAAGSTTGWENGGVIWSWSEHSAARPCRSFTSAASKIIAGSGGRQRGSGEGSFKSIVPGRSQQGLRDS